MGDRKRAYEKYAFKFWAKEVLRNWYCDMSIKTRVINILKVSFFISINRWRLSYEKIIFIKKLKRYPHPALKLSAGQMKIEIILYFNQS